MFWRLPPDEYEAAFRRRSLEKESGGPNKDAMATVVREGTVPGLLAYRDGIAVGWAAISPRTELSRLEHVSTLRADSIGDDSRAWSLACFYVHRSHWRTGVATALMEAAVARAIDREASLVEGYPVRAPSVDPYTGYDAMFAAAGFELVRPGRGRGRALWRKQLSG